MVCLSGKWDDRRNDWLGDFILLSREPGFRRLHGRVDDRIADWFRAHEAAQPGAVTPRRGYRLFRKWSAGKPVPVRREGLFRCDETGPGWLMMQIPTP